MLEGHENAVQALASSPQTMCSPPAAPTRRYGCGICGRSRLKRTYREHSRFRHRVRVFAQRHDAGGRRARRPHSAMVDASSRRLRTLNGHKGRITELAFSPDEDLLASAGEDGTVRCGTPARPHLALATGHTGGAKAVAFTPDGQNLARPATTASCACGHCRSRSSRKNSSARATQLRFPVNISIRALRCLDGPGERRHNARRFNKTKRGGSMELDAVLLPACSSRSRSPSTSSSRASRSACRPSSRRCWCAGG